MARSFRDRFYTPKVARAVTSPSAIVAAGAGAAIGLVATAPLALPVGIAAALVGGLIGYGGRVALAIPRAEEAPKIDPFAVREPWREAVLDAVRAKARFGEAVAKVPAGPLRDTLVSVGERLDAAVEECFKVAQQGQLVADARTSIDDKAVARDLRLLQGQIPQGVPPTPTQARTLEALQSQLGSAQRMDDLIASTRSQLELINARLDQSVTEAIELSVSNRTAGLAPLGGDVDQIVDDLTSLRQAMADVDGPSAAPAPPTAGPATDPAGDPTATTAPATEPATEPGP